MAGTGAGGGETAKEPSGFTVDTLQTLVNSVLNERDRRYEQRFIAQEQAVKLALDRVDKEFHEHLAQVRAETHAALDAADKAIAKAEAATEKRFESVNEFRAQLSDQTRTFMPRAESIQRHEQTAEKVAALENRHSADVALINSRLDLNTGRGIGIEKGWSLLIGLAGLVGGIIAIIVTVAK